MHKQYGGVSIFIVIFTALLLTVVTTSFVRIMILNQQQASNNDLSQSAYDAAMAGVEDAKRALVAMRNCENDSGCQVEDNFYKYMGENATCESLEQIEVSEFEKGEVRVGAEAQNQAYTCVKINHLSDSFVTDIIKADGDPVLVPLKSTESFNKVKISWFQRGEDIASSETDTLDIPPNGALLPKIGGSNWPSTRPALLRTQLIQFKKSEPIDLNEFNRAGTPNSRTLFLMPSTIDPELSFAGDVRRDTEGSTNKLEQVKCTEANLNDNEFACSAMVALVNPAGGNAANREAYLAFSAIYNSSRVKIELFNGDKLVKFKGVQPTVDSTGRSADQFRRVQARIELKDGSASGVYPDAALKVANNLCKNFFVTDKIGDYNKDSSCK